MSTQHFSSQDFKVEQVSDFDPFAGTMLMSSGECRQIARWHKSQPFALIAAKPSACEGQKPQRPLLQPCDGQPSVETYASWRLGCRSDGKFRTEVFAVKPRASGSQRRRLILLDGRYPKLRLFTVHFNAAHVSLLGQARDGTGLLTSFSFFVNAVP